MECLNLVFNSGEKMRFGGRKNQVHPHPTISDNPRPILAVSHIQLLRNISFQSFTFGIDTFFRNNTLHGSCSEINTNKTRIMRI